MKLILTQDVDNLGSRGEQVTVRDGYGRNFLIPRGLAVVANSSNLKRYQEEERQAAHKISRAKTDAAGLAERLQSVELTIPARVGEENRIFGTVTTQQVADALAAKGVEVDRRKIELDEEIRMLGVYTATLRLHRDVSAQVRVRVVPEEEAGA